jgi:hypothetical protein
MKTMRMIRIAFLCSTLSLVFLTSCFDKMANTETFAVDIAVIDYYDGFPDIPSDLPFLSFAYSMPPNPAIAAPELKGKYKQGDCLFVSFTINYDNQPNSKYFSATDVQHIKISKTNITMLDAEIHNISDTIDVLSVDSIKAISIVGSLPCINNNLFLGFDQLNPEQSYEYQLVYSDSLIQVNDTLEVPILYVCADAKKPASATSYGNYKCQAFDMTRFLEKYTNRENNSFTFFLYYKAGKDAKGNNIYKSLSRDIDKNEDKSITLTNYRFSAK